MTLKTFKLNRKQDPIFFQADDGTGGGGGLTVQKQTGNFTATLGVLENCNTQGGAITASLPPVASANTSGAPPNQITLINNPPSGGNNLMITPAGADTISNAAGSLVLGPGESVQLYADTTANNWMVIP